MTSSPHLRDGTERDFDALGELMYAAIHNGHTQYSKAQSPAWAPEPRRGRDWAERLAEKSIIVAEDTDRILGFMTVQPGGYIDFAFIRPAAQGTGLFRQLYEAIERRAMDWKEPSLSTHASLMAQPAFAAVGFQIVQREIVRVDTQKLKRAEMTKSL